MSGGNQFLFNEHTFIGAKSVCNKIEIKTKIK